MTTPITSLDLPDDVPGFAANLRPDLGSDLNSDLGPDFFSKGLVTAVMTGSSALTSLAGLSSRSPLNAACRMLPSPVQPANSISATSSGFSQCISRVLRGAFLPANGLSSDALAFSAGMIRL